MRGFPAPSSVADGAEDAEEDDEEEEEEEEEEDAEDDDESSPSRFGKPKVAVLPPANDSMATRASMAAPAASATASSDPFAVPVTVPEARLAI